jgi:tyrosyl-tRNA synthetase
VPDGLRHTTLPPAASRHCRQSPAAPTCPLSLPSPLCRLTLEEKFALCRSVGEECIQESELLRLLEKKPNIVAYDGFEPSGRMHIAQGVLKALNVNKLTKCGVTFKFW